MHVFIYLIETTSCISLPVVQNSFHRPILWFPFSFVDYLNGSPNCLFSLLDTCQSNLSQHFSSEHKKNKKTSTESCLNDKHSSLPPCLRLYYYSYVDSFNYAFTVTRMNNTRGIRMMFSSIHDTSSQRLCREEIIEESTFFLGK